MRLGTIAFLLGDLLVQRLAALPNSLLLLPLLALAVPVWRRPRLRLLLWLSAGAAWAVLHGWHTLGHGLAPALEGADVSLVGCVASLPEHQPNRTRFLLEVRQMWHDEMPVSSPGRVRLSWYGERPRLVAGQCWRLQARLKRPHGFMNPGGFDYEAWLFSQGIRATGYVRRGQEARRVADAGLLPLVDALRQRLAEHLRRLLERNAQAGLVAALTIGDRQDISRRQWEVLLRTGTNHLVAISGLHVGMVAALGFLLGRRLWSWLPGLCLHWPAPKAGAVVGLGAAAAYAALAGFSVPTQRALVMVAVFAGSVLLQRAARPSASLAVALLLVLVLDPMAVAAAGFWLSFAAVALILYGMHGRIGAEGDWWQWGRVQWLVALGLLPVILALFQRCSVVGPLANLIAVPWVGLVVAPTALAGALLLPLVPSLGDILLLAAAQGLGGLWSLLQWLSAQPYASISLPMPPGWAVASGLLGVAMLVAPRGLPGRWLGAVWMLPLLLARPPAPPWGEAWLTVLDVGQGLSAVLRTSEHTLVYDTGPSYGGRFDAGDAALLPFLRQQGVVRVDTVVVSHADSDHSGGLASLLAGLPVRRVLSSAPDALAWARPERCQAGQHWHWDGVELRMLHPPRRASCQGNQCSCVLAVRTRRGGRVLLPGDIGGEAERDLARTQPAALRAELLVAPHHGSATSSGSEFVAAVAPRVVAYAVGYRNRFGFPDPAVVARYAALSSEAYDTASSGAITFRIRGVDEVAPPQRWRLVQRRYWQFRREF